MDPVVAWLAAALAGLAGFTAWLIRDRIADLVKTRDVALTGWREQTDATRELTAAIKEKDAHDRQHQADWDGRMTSRPRPRARGET